VKKEFIVQGMSCSECASTVKKVLASVENVTDVSVNFEKSSAVIAMEGPVPALKLQEALSGYPAYKLLEKNGQHYDPRSDGSLRSFWLDRNIWRRAALNTLNCLIGCSIGDFGTIIYLQAYHPGTTMIVQMILATLAGLITSVLLETLLLKFRENFPWRTALQTALAMSFLSMLAMELAMNTTDFMLTGGKAAFENPVYWAALCISLVVGFLVPLPYNYYKLKKYSKACH
jgi:cation transport ATPase